MILKINFHTPLLLIFCIAIFCGCEKEFNYGNSKNAVKTLAATDILQTSAIVSGTVVTDNGASLSARGICYGTSNNPLVSGLKKQAATATLGDFSGSLDNLNPGTLYYARTYATNTFGTAYGNEVSFTTLAATTPVINSTTSANSITATSANTGGNIINSGASNVTSRGVCWSNTVTVPTISGNKTVDGTGSGIFVSSLTGLTANTLYYIRAYATNSIGTSYGDVKTFSTSTATTPSGIITSPVLSITQTSSISGGNITSDGGSSITSRGVCWSNATTTPTILNSRTFDGTGIGSFSSQLTNLMPGNTYYVRAYATNGAGTVYGNVLSFSTFSPTLPIGISTNTISSISQTSAFGGGSISGDGGAAITSRGICWSNLTSAPTIANTRTIDGSGTGSFSSSLSNLSAGTTYYVRAYATNAAGTAYGNLVVFNTVAATIPTGIITASISLITSTSASGGGSISGDGGNPITSRGICWSSVTTFPTIFNSLTNNGTGIGSFTSSITGLSANTTYYVRAYATNSIGTSYGNAVAFTTQSPPLTIGQSYQGGIIAYIFQPSDIGYIAGQTHGLIAGTSNQSTGVSWGCSGTSISTSSIIGTGQTNTTTIVNNCITTNIAARICDNLILGGYSDWFLPSSDELLKLYLNRSVIGGFVNTLYWSSSQNTSTNSLSVNFGTGGLLSSAKTSLLYVRAVRKF